ncbi:hypothetical protein DERF_008182 [Dermatophagoides farinae]|uniref:Uncharacterized protein n=1 Tax=Dermatophagoides farinae TaxID=6954 RepID=A0A922HZF4_DERFA|nr:hypothetical protein DERF_008182 [Dermatophagoides farinae]
MAISINCLIIPGGQALLKAPFMSNDTSATSSLFFKLVSILVFNFSKACSVERHCMKPYWYTDNGQFASKWLLIRLAITASKALARIGRRPIGL